LFPLPFNKHFPAAISHACRAFIRATTINTNNVPSHRIHLVPHPDSRRTLSLKPISRDIRDGDPPLRIGRYTRVATDKVTFKSEAVSRAHAEIWSDNGKFYIKDTKSSSGTFLNELRLSPAGLESTPHQIKDGDIVQLGVDYQGGTEDIHKSIKLIIEVERDLQAAPNGFKYALSLPPLVCLS
jgi:pSer/pThr/pTyr-binding forkhead associated (FHA) protein